MGWRAWGVLRGHPASPGPRERWAFQGGLNHLKKWAGLCPTELSSLPVKPLGAGFSPDTSPGPESEGLTSDPLPPTFPPYKGPIRCQVSFPGIKIQPVASGQERWGQGSQASDLSVPLELISHAAYLPTPQGFRVSPSANWPGRYPPATHLPNTSDGERSAGVSPTGEPLSPSHPIPTRANIISQAAFPILKRNA